jgi:hypothetical protein
MNKFGDRHHPCLTPLALYFLCYHQLLFITNVTVYTTTSFLGSFLMFGANQMLASHIGELPSGSAVFHYRLRTVTLSYFGEGIFYSVFHLSFVYSKANHSFISFFRVPTSSSAMLYYMVCGQVFPSLGGQLLHLINITCHKKQSNNINNGNEL